MAMSRLGRHGREDLTEPGSKNVLAGRVVEVPPVGLPPLPGRDFEVVSFYAWHPLRRFNEKGKFSQAVRQGWRASVQVPLDGAAGEGAVLDIWRAHENTRWTVLSQCVNGDTLEIGDFLDRPEVEAELNRLAVERAGRY